MTKAVKVSWKLICEVAEHYIPNQGFHDTASNCTDFPGDREGSNSLPLLQQKRSGWGIGQSLINLRLWLSIPFHFWRRQQHPGTDHLIAFLTFHFWVFIWVPRENNIAFNTRKRPREAFLHSATNSFSSLSSHLPSSAWGVSPGLL